MRKLLFRRLSTLRAVSGRNSGDTVAADQWSRQASLSTIPVRKEGFLPRSEQSFRLGSWDEVTVSSSRSFSRHTAALICGTELSSITGVGQGTKSYATSPPSGAGDVEDGEEGPTAGDASNLLPEKEFHKLADKVLHQLQEKLEEQGDDVSIDGFDTDYADGVLTVRLGSFGTYVLNKQTPNRQIWFSSPVSGPARFDWIEADGSWIYKRTKVELVSFLENELSNLLEARIVLT